MAPRLSFAPLGVALVGVALAGAPHGAAEAQQAGVNAVSTSQAPNELDRAVAQLDAEERALRTELDDMGPKLDVVRKRMIARGRAYYRLVRAGLLPAGGGFDAMVDHAAHVERTRYALERDITTEAGLIKRGTEIDARLNKVRIDRAPLDVQREAMARARLALQETEERRAAFTRAFETSVRPDSVAVYGADTGPADGDARSGFRALKGRLPFPIAGRAEVRKVTRASAGGPGLELTASLGAAVRAVAAGRVAFADRYDDYGLTVILDHGDHYYSLYANLRSADVHAGDTLASGARIGVVGSDGARGAALYFELRRNTATLDPSPWLGL